MKLKKRNSIWLLTLIVIFVISKFFIIDQVINRPLNDYDEARYAEVSKNMLITGELLIPLAGGPDEPRNHSYTKLNNGQDLYPFFWKPPLIIWLQAISMKIFGINEFASRLPSLIASLGTLVILHLLLKIYNVRKTIAYTLLFAFTLTYDFSFISTQGTTDALLTFLGTSVVFLAHKKYKHGVMMASILTGLAFLTKSIAAFWVPALYIFIITSLNEFSLKTILKYLYWTLVVASPWFIFMYMKFGDIFIERHFLFNANGGAAGGQNFAPFQWYIIYMLDMWKPLIFLVPIILYALLQDINEKKLKYFIPFIWACVILIPFSLSKSKVWWYIYPMWPPFILLIALALQHIEKNIRHVALSGFMVVVSILPFWQLSSQHIPLKEFLLFIIVTTGILCTFQNIVRNINDRFIVVMMIVIITASTYSWYTNFPKNPTQNNAIKKLALRNQGLSRISVIGMPYEAALFYFNTGNVITDIGHYDQEKYVLHNSASAQLDLKKFTLIDKESNLYLYKRNE